MNTYNDTADTPVKLKMAEMSCVSDNGYSSEFILAVTKSANWMFSFRMKKSSINTRMAASSARRTKVS